MVSIDTALIVGTIVAMNSIMLAVFMAIGMDAVNKMTELKMYHIKNANANENILAINRQMLKFFMNDLTHWLKRNDKY